MELQALRYAAMVSAMTFSKAVQTFDQDLKGLGRAQNAQTVLLEFLDWESPLESDFARDVRIAAAASHSYPCPAAAIDAASHILRRPSRRLQEGTLARRD
jgi:hypothetical protein